MNKKIYPIFFLMLLVSLTFVSAQPPVTTVQQFPEGFILAEQQIHTFKLGEPLRYGFILENSTDGRTTDNSTIEFCRMITSNSQGLNTQVSNISYITEYHLWGLGLNESEVLRHFPEIGYYNYLISCQDSVGGSLTGIFEITESGLSSDQSSRDKIYISIILILFFSTLIYILSYINEKINYDKWYSNMQKKYQTRNLVKFGASALIYNIMKNAYVIYYLIGLVLMTILSNLSYTFNLMYAPLMNTLLTIYLWGAVLIGLFLLSNVQEWIIKWKEDIEKINWGMQ